MPVRSRVLIAWLAHEGLLCCKVLFACQAVAPAWVALLPLSKVHPNRPNVLLLVLKFQYCNIGYWTSISRICVWEKIPRRTQSKLGKSWLSEHFRRQGFWPGSPWISICALSPQHPSRQRNFCKLMFATVSAYLMAVDCTWYLLFLACF
jgi:hypothetical protein